jgi:hypothetical protein
MYVYIQYIQYIQHIQYIQYIQYIQCIQYIQHIQYIQYIQYITITDQPQIWNYMEKKENTVPWFISNNFVFQNSYLN